MKLNQHENDMDLIQFTENINAFPRDRVDINYPGTKNTGIRTSEYEK